MTTAPTNLGVVCQWCGRTHLGVCPSIDVLEYWPNGAIRRVRFRGGEARPGVVTPPTDDEPFDLDAYAETLFRIP